MKSRQAKKGWPSTSSDWAVIGQDRVLGLLPFCQIQHPLVNMRAEVVTAVTGKTDSSGHRSPALISIPEDQTYTLHLKPDSAPQGSSQLTSLNNRFLPLCVNFIIAFNFMLAISLPFHT